MKGTGKVVPLTVTVFANPMEGAPGGTPSYGNCPLVLLEP